MCSHGRDELDAFLLAAARARPAPAPARELFQTLMTRHEVCVAHFDQALRRALAGGALATAGDQKTSVGDGIDALLEAQVAPGPSAPAGVATTSAPAATRRVLGGRYELVERLGGGSAGEVWRAEDRSLHRRPVAVKIISLDRLAPEARDEALARFEREVRILSKLDHPNVVPIYACGRDGVEPRTGDLWYAMEYAPGGTLADRIAGGPVAAAELLALSIPIVEGLAAALDLSILHRDVKPSNVLLSRVGAPLVADFGLARILPRPGEPATARALTRPGTPLGTVMYMAPEICDGRDYDHRADIYSLGATLYHAGAGRPLFQLEPTPSNFVEWKFHAINVEPPDLLTHAPDFDRDFALVIHRALAKSPEARWPNYKALLAELYRLVPKIRHARPTRPATARRGASSPPGTGLATAALRGLEAEAFSAVEDWQERFGAAAWSANPGFMQALWSIAKSRGLLAICAGLQDAVPATEFESRLEEALDALASGEPPGSSQWLSPLPLDLPAYVWTALRKADTANASGLVADTSGAEALVAFLKDPSAIVDPSLAAFALAPAAEAAAPALPSNASVVQALEAIEVPVERATSSVPPPLAASVARGRGGASLPLAGAPLIPGYDILEELGEGGMGAVYKARQVAVDRIVALKIFRPHPGLDDAARERFKREAMNAARITHPHVVQIYDAGQTEAGLLWIAMEYVPGRTLEELRQTELRLMHVAALSKVRKIAEGLQALHKQGLVHRDVKPANILVDGDTVKITDFGLLRPPRRGRLTEENVFIGTPSYASPEQVESKPLDLRTDIFSLGVVLYELLTNKLPFDGLTELLNLEHTPAPVAELVPAVPPAVSALVARMIAKRPEDRIPNTHELIAEIDRILDEPAAAAPPAQAQARSTWPLAAGIAFVVMAVVVGIALLRPPAHPQPPVVLVDDRKPAPPPPSGPRPDPPKTTDTSPPPPPPSPAVEIAPGQLLPVIVTPTAEDLATPAADATKAQRMRHAIAMEATSSWGPGRDDTLSRWMSRHTASEDELQVIRAMWTLLDAERAAIDRGDFTRAFAAVRSLRGQSGGSPYTEIVCEAAEQMLCHAVDLDARFRATLAAGRTVTLLRRDGKEITGVIQRVSEKSLVLLPAGSETELEILREAIAPESALLGVSDVYERLEFQLQRGDFVQAARDLLAAVDPRSGPAREPEALRLVPTAIHALVSRGVRACDGDDLERVESLAAVLGETRSAVPASFAYAFEPEGLLAHELDAARTLRAKDFAGVIEKHEGTRAYPRAVARLLAAFRGRDSDERVAGGQVEDWEFDPFESDLKERQRHLYSDPKTKSLVIDQAEGQRTMSRTIEEISAGYSIEFRFAPHGTAPRESAGWGLVLTDMTKSAYLQLEIAADSVSLFEVASGQDRGKLVQSAPIERRDAFRTLVVMRAGKLLLVYHDDALLFKVAPPAGAALDRTIRIAVGGGALRLRSLLVPKPE